MNERASSDARIPKNGIDRFLSILENPRWHGPDLMKQEIKRLDEENRLKKEALIKKASRKWRDDFSAKAVSGHRDASNFLKQADLPPTSE